MNSFIFAMRHFKLALCNWPIFATLMLSISCLSSCIPTNTITVSESITDIGSSTPTLTLIPATIPSPAPYFPTPPDRDLYALSSALTAQHQDPIPQVVNLNPVTLQEGHQDIFTVLDVINTNVYPIKSTLRLVTPHAYWYVEEDLSISFDNLKYAAKTFEENIYPKVTQIFGTESNPGIDNDPHLTILHARLRGVAGYYSSVDEYPREVRPYSNEREMIYINVSALKIGSEPYLATLAHELQHAAHWIADPSEVTWVQEGLAQIAETVVGYQPHSLKSFYRSPTISFLQWPLDTENSAPYYGGSFLFLKYLTDHYGTKLDIIKLVKEPLDGIHGINKYLMTLGYNITFEDVFKKWLVANMLDEPGNGHYSHVNANFRLRNTDTIHRNGNHLYSSPQYGARYIKLNTDKPSIKLRFQGPTETPLLPTSPPSGSYCWWSNRGDSISSTLTRKLTLTHVSQATLKFQVWYETEDNWDYGYIQVSTDNGTTWDVLASKNTTTNNPVGNSYGPGYSGYSKGWINDSVDLSPYAGQEILLRFHYITDDAINGSGICIDDISIPETGFYDNVETIDREWESSGFIRTNNLTPQSFVVLIVTEGTINHVLEMDLDRNNFGELTLNGLDKSNPTTIIVAPIAPVTLQETSYSFNIE